MSGRTRSILTRLERQCLGWLTPCERARREKLLTPSLRHTFLLSRVLCRVSLSHYAEAAPREWIFAENSYGKPFVSSPAKGSLLHFNLTHTEGLVAYAVTRAGEIGIDAEKTSREMDVEGVARLTLSPEESLRFNPLPRDQRKARLFEYWVLKEAYLKAVGTGLWKPLAEVTIHWDDRGHLQQIDGWQLSLHRPKRVSAHAASHGTVAQWDEQSRAVGLDSEHIAAIAVRPRRGSEHVPIAWRLAEKCYKLASPS